jgi:hypothetical protein
LAREVESCIVRQNVGLFQGHESSSTPGESRDTTLIQGGALENATDARRSEIPDNFSKATESAAKILDVFSKATRNPRRRQVSRGSEVAKEPWVVLALARAIDFLPDGGGEPKHSAAGWR